MVRVILKPEKNSLTIKLPDSFIGKVIEVLAFKIEENDNNQTAILGEQNRIEAINKAMSEHRVDLSDFKFDRGEANDYN
jgi:hypothetical protein